jgi:hypothetical protein
MLTNPDVLKRFGFNHRPLFANKSKLLGVYQGLRRMDVTVKDLNKWQGVA